MSLPLAKSSLILKESALLLSEVLLYHAIYRECLLFLNKEHNFLRNYHPVLSRYIYVHSEVAWQHPVSILALEWVRDLLQSEQKLIMRWIICPRWVKSHVMSYLRSVLVGLVQDFSRENGRDFLKSKSVSRESNRVNSGNTSVLVQPYQVYLVSLKDIALPAVSITLHVN